MFFIDFSGCQLLRRGEFQFKIRALGLDNILGCVFKPFFTRVLIALIVMDTNFINLI